MSVLNPIPYFLLPAIVVLLAATPCGYASTFWTGPNTAFYHTDENGLQDTLATDVKITRGASGGGLYNTAMSEASGTFGISPKGTLWATNITLAQYMANPASAGFVTCPLEAGHSPPGWVGHTFVVHLTSVSDDIYLQLTLTNWGAAGGFGDHTFGYIRSTAAVTPPTPTVSITNPVNNAIFIGPTNLGIGASATVSGGTVTNVQFFTNNIPLKSITTAPFVTVATNLTAGAYALKAVATAGGISATSAVVNITVLAAPAVSITNPISGGVFAAPANIHVGATATAGSGAVTNVQFFTNGIPYKSVTAPPFALTVSNLAAGSYGLTAAATASGISATSAPVNVSVVNPAPVNLSGAHLAGGNFSFNYNVSTGLTYTVEGSSNLMNWVPLVTNTPATTPVPFSNPATNRAQYYRIGLLPNP